MKLNFRQKQNLFFFLNLFLATNLIFSTACKLTRTYVADQKISQFKMNAANDSDTSVEKTILPYRAKMSAQMDEVIGTAAKELSSGRNESTLGNWVCDLMMEQSVKFLGTQADMAFTNSGGLRIRSIMKGNITVGKIYELMPFDNIYVLVQCDSAMIQKLCDELAKKGGGPLSGARYEIAQQKAKNITIGGKLLQSSRTYEVATIDYLVNGGSDMGFLKPLPRKDKGIFLRDVLIEGVRTAKRKGKAIDAVLDGRIIVNN